MLKLSQFRETLGLYARSHANPNSMQLVRETSEEVAKSQFASIKQEIEAKNLHREYTRQEIAKIEAKYPDAIDWILFEL